MEAQIQSQIPGIDHLISEYSVVYRIQQMHGLRANKLANLHTTLGLLEPCLQILLWT